MLSNEEKLILQTNISLILKQSPELTQNKFIEIYNFVYSHCTAYSSEYIIKGSSVYDFISEMLDGFASSLVFKGSLKLLSEQIYSLRASSNLIVSVLSYLERFYIRSSLLKDNSQVKTIKDLFYYKVYYKYIYNIEGSLLDLIFLEVDTYRKIYKQDSDDLTNVVTFYLDVLQSTGQEGAIRRFHQRYLEDFKACINFKSEIGKLLKKIYFEMFFISNSLKEKDMCKEIIQMVVARKDEIVDYAISKIENFEKFKHIYKIISMMPEYARNKFKIKYEDFMKLKFQNVDSFEKIYTNFTDFKQQIALNKVAGYDEILNEVVKICFFNLNGKIQMKIYREMISEFDRFLTKTEVQNNKELLNISDSGNSSKYVKDVSFISAEVYFELFSILISDLLLDLYAENCQYRLLMGSDPVIEQIYAEAIIDKVGWSSASRIKSSVGSFLQKYYLKMPDYTLNRTLEISIAKITKPFWNLNKSETKLHDKLIPARNCALNSVQLDQKQIFDFNYEVSPIIFELNNTRYKMASDVFSLYLYILENRSSGGISYDMLREKSSDKNFDSNIKILLENGFIHYGEMIKPMNKICDQKFVDLFVIKKREHDNDVKINACEMITQINEAKICKIMKKSKRISRNKLFKAISCENEEFDKIIANLATREYLDIDGDDIVYMP